MCCDTLKLGQDSLDACETEIFCNGELKEDFMYYLWLLSENKSGKIFDFGPLEDFETANFAEIPPSLKNQKERSLIIAVIVYRFW